MNPSIGNLPQPLDLKLYRGATEALMLTARIMNADGSFASLFDLTGWSAKLQIRAQAGDTTVLAELSTANGLIVLAGTAGTITINWAAANTAAYAFDRGVYDLMMTDDAGSISYFIAGKISVSASVTQ